MKVLLATLSLFFLTAIADPSMSSSLLSPDTTPKQPMDITWDQQQGVFDYGRRAMAEECLVQPGNLWCQEVKLAESALSAWDIANISLRVREKFHYVSDKEDNWRNHAGAVLMNGDWYGDCDDLATTTLDLMIRSGQPRSQVWFVLADVQHKTILDHMIALVRDRDGHLWVVGDTAAQNIYPIDKLTYRIIGLASAANVGRWLDPHDVPGIPQSVMQGNKIAPPPPTPLELNLPSLKDLLDPWRRP